MSEPESSPSNQSRSLTELKKDFEKISEVATSQASEVAQPDDLSFDEKRQSELEREREDLDQVKRINKAQLLMLKALFVLIVLWLFSVMLLTGIRGFNLSGLSCQIR